MDNNQNEYDILGMFDRLAIKKIDLLIGQGAVVRHITLSDKYGNVAQVDRFGKVTWENKKDEIPIDRG